ncbi:MAG: glucose-6-phosphate dehydrogenase, partial [Proteobacteria bacterium]|nr:glucose-6-phosphate dehydrogenase [Pseudomonadota bacterium]
MANPPPAEKPADALVLFGATGDLSRRMVLPSLYFLDADGHLPVDFKIVGSARTQLSREEFVAEVKKILDSRPEHIDEGVWERFAQRLDYVAGDATSKEGATELKPHLQGFERPMFFLAISPSLYAKVAKALGDVGLAGEDSRIVLEKPIGRDLETSRQLNEAVGAVFAEERIFRIDHYLGKETVQNLIALRFANTLFEPLWNNLT